MPIRPILVPSLLAVAALAAGCGSSGSGGSGSSGASSSSSSNTSSSTGSSGGYGRSGTGGSSGTTASGARTITTAKAAGLGTILVDNKGMAVYLFDKDKGPTSTCYSACAKFWPPVTTSGKPKAASSTMASKLSTAKRRDGSLQVVYGGHPLYYYAPDSPGTTRGQGSTNFGAKWEVLAPAGQGIEGAGAS